MCAQDPHGMRMLVLGSVGLSHASVQKLDFAIGSLFAVSSKGGNRTLRMGACMEVPTETVGKLAGELCRATQGSSRTK